MMRQASAAPFAQASVRFRVRCFILQAKRDCSSQAEKLRSHDAGTTGNLRMSFFNVVIGFFDGSGSSDVNTGRFYGLKGDVERFKGQAPTDKKLKALCIESPAIFTEEIGPNRVPLARLGWITSITDNGRAYRVTYHLPSGLPAIRADRLAEALDLTNKPDAVGDMQHSKWHLHEGDLFKILNDNGLLDDTTPKVFERVRQPIQAKLVSAMMPFTKDFSPVYEAIQAAADDAGGISERADNVWDHSTIIQDIYSLIYRSAVVVCDFSGKNANVFYEAGIAHSLGRDVIPIVQHVGDIPFDLQGHRAIIYLNNAEGREQLGKQLKARIKTLFERGG